MGESFGIIYSRSSDFAAVRAACESVATSLEKKFLLIPSETRWTSIYPSDAGQDESVSKRLAQSHSAPLLHLILHDSDLVVAHLYRGSELVDTFVSIPDYFEEVAPEVREQVRGNAEAYRDILPAASRVADLAALFRELSGAERLHVPFGGSEGVRRLARFLELPGPLVAYEDLAERTRRPKGAVQVPDPGIDRARKREAAARVKRQVEELRRERLLLASESRRGPGKGALFHPDPVVVEDGEDGFYVLWCEHGSAVTSSPLVRVAPPWSEAPQPSGIELASTVHSLALSPDGRRLAVGHANGRWEIEVWNLATNAREAVWAVSRVANVIAFTSDGKRLAYECEGAFRIADARTGRTVLELAGNPSSRAAAMHPGGRYFVFDRGYGLSGLDLESGREVAVLDYPARDEAQWRAAVVRGEAASGFRPSEEAHAFAFDARGEQLAIAMDVGVRVLRWDALLTAEKELPESEIFVEAPLVEVAKLFRMQGVYGVFFDAEGRLVFGGLDGTLGVVSPHDGGRTRVLEVPGRPPLYSFVGARDRRTLALVARPRMFERRRDPAEFQIWNLAALASRPGV